MTDADRALVALAMVYAEHIDDGQDVVTFGPLLAGVLAELLMTPKARQAVLKGVAGESALTSPLDQLRQRRERRTASD